MHLEKMDFFKRFRKETVLTPDDLRRKRIQPLSLEDQQVYKKSAKSLDMKILVRGPRQSGKSTLIRLMKGHKINSRYQPTPELSSHHLGIRSDDFLNESIKLELWDVVDKAEGYSDGEQEQVIPSPLSQSTEFGTLAKADASLIDVYPNCHGVIFLQRDDGEYLFHEIENVPKGCFILVALNESPTPPETVIGKVMSIRSDLKISVIKVNSEMAISYIKKWIQLLFLNYKKSILETTLLTVNESIDKTHVVLDEMDVFSVVEKKEMNESPHNSNTKPSNTLLPSLENHRDVKDRPKKTKSKSIDVAEKSSKQEEAIVKKQKDIVEKKHEDESKIDDFVPEEDDEGFWSDSED